MWVAVNIGHQTLWDGPARTIPWWWTYIIQLERRLDSLRETAGTDPEHKAPPKEDWPLSRHASLDEWFEQRQALQRQMLTEPKAMGDWND